MQGEEKAVCSKYPSVLAKVIEAFESAGCETYLIGPRARDLALGEPMEGHSSFDLTVDASFSKIGETFEELFNAKPESPKDEKPKILTFKVPKEEPDEEHPHWTFNVGPFRNYLPSLKCLRKQKLTGILLDLATREITIQAFAYDSQGNLIDPFAGTEDLKHGIIRPVFPVDIFRESSVWLLKIARYVARYGFKAGPEVVSAATRDAQNILDCSREMWLKEIEKTILGAHAGFGLQFLADTRVLGFILPEVASLAQLSNDSKGLHKDVWAHTKQVVENADEDVVIRWAALCHDIGKVWTRQVFPGEKVHFFRHEDMSALLFEGIAYRLGMPDEQGKRVMYIIKNHSRVNLYREEWTDSAVRRLVNEVGEHLTDLIAFSRADLTSKRQDKVELIRALLADLQVRAMAIMEEQETQTPLPKGIGHKIMERFSLQPGPEVGRLRNILLEEIAKGVLPSQAVPEVYLSFLERHLQSEKEKELDV
jgi:tRNA nucleotidyltransferase/poly(A) polymerase